MPGRCNDLGVKLIPLPNATISDARVACVLRNAVEVINPALDLLSGTDLLGLKERTHALGESDAAGAKVLDGLAWVLDVAEVPGTKTWDDMKLDDRIDWWVGRVGALDTLVVAFPGAFGAVADRLPVQDFLGFANQAIVLCALARESGVTDRGAQVRLLGSVMCDRDLDGVGPGSDVGNSSGAAEPRSFAQSLWQVAGLLRAVDQELGRRPRPRSFFRYLGMLPAVGAVADYFGEYGALVRAAKEGRGWIARHELAAAEG